MAASTQHANAEKPTEITENGVTIEYKIGSTPSEKAKAYNSRISLFREFALCALKVLVSEMDHPPFALDAISATGLAGLQWKCKLGGEVHVTLAEREERQLLQIGANAKRNGLSVVESTLQASHVACYPDSTQPAHQVALTHADPCVLSLLHVFDFVYLDVHKNLPTYFETMFRNVRHRGVATLLVPDISMFSRSPHVISRHYGATIIKTEYLKELAARTVIAAIIRSAARCNKGVEVLYVFAHEDFLFLGLRVLRGPKQADHSVSQLRRVLHCQMCEERIFLPDSRAPIESPYSLLPCHCQEHTPGKTAVELGPVWAGPLSSPGYLRAMLEACRGLKMPSPQLWASLTTLLTEALGGQADPLTSSPTPQGGVPRPPPPSGDASPLQKLQGGGANGHSEKQENCRREESRAEGDGDVGEKQGGGEGDGQGGKRPREEEEEAEEREDQPSRKRHRGVAEQQGAEQVDPALCPPFYYNMQTQKLKNTTLPKLSLLMAMLRAGGFHACRTHFDPCALRTSATLDVLLHIVRKGTVPPTSAGSATMSSGSASTSSGSASTSSGSATKSSS